MAQLAIDGMHGDGLVFLGDFEGKRAQRLAYTVAPSRPL